MDGAGIEVVAPLPLENVPIPIGYPRPAGGLHLGTARPLLLVNTSAAPDVVPVSLMPRPESARLFIAVWRFASTVLPTLARDA